MLTWEELEKAELGRTFDIRALNNCCKAVYGGVSWPGKRPGFTVIVAMNRICHIDSHDICLLDEFESFDIRELVRQCGVLDFKYLPVQWIGDWKNDAAWPFIQEMNNGSQGENRTHRRQLSLGWTPLFEMEQFYPYILAEIRRLIASDYRQLYLKDSKIRAYLSEIHGDEITELERGDYPAIEALAYAVIEMRHWAESENNIDPRSLLPDYIGI